MSAALEQQRDLPSKHVASEELDREPSPEKPGSNSRSSTSNGVDSTGHSRGGTPDQRRRSPSSATQEAASTLVQMSNTQPLAKQNSQSPKKPSTPVQKRESVEEVADKFVSVSINSCFCLILILFSFRPTPLNISPNQTISKIFCLTAMMP